MPDIKPILLVEDNPNDLELTLHALERSLLANEVVIARDGAEAVDWLKLAGAHKGRVAGDPGRPRRRDRARPAGEVRGALPRPLRRAARGGGLGPACAEHRREPLAQLGVRHVEGAVEVAATAVSVPDGARSVAPTVNEEVPIRVIATVIVTGSTE